MNIHNEIAADPQTALDHFEKLLSLETDCWDVHAALASGAPGFVLPEHARKLSRAGMFRARSISRTAESMNAISPPIPRIRYSLSIAAGRIATEPTALQLVWRAWAGK